MAYGDAQFGDEERRKQKRRFMMEQISFDADMKKNHRAQEALTAQERKITQEIKRLQVERENVTQQMKKLKEQEAFFASELRRIKKELTKL